MKINYACVSRSLIALLFVIAGVNKLMDFTNTAGYIGSLGLPLPVIATLLVILVEIPVALAFAWGYKTRETGYTLIAFTVLATILVHRDISGPMGQINMLMALKNIAVVGGIMSAIACVCGDCTVHSKKSS